MHKLLKNNPYLPITFPVLSFYDFITCAKIQPCWVKMVEGEINDELIGTALNKPGNHVFGRIKSILSGQQRTLYLNYENFVNALAKTFSSVAVSRKFAEHEVLMSACYGGLSPEVDYLPLGSLSDEDVKNINGLYGIGKTTSMIGLKSLCENLVRMGFPGIAEDLLDRHKDVVSLDVKSRYERIKAIRAA